MDYILDYYQMGLFTDADMALFIKVGFITQDQYDTLKKPKAI